MKHLHLSRALQYKIKDAIPGVAGFFAIITAISIVFTVGTWQLSINLNGTTSGSINGYGPAATIMLFVFGIVAIREDLRLFLQNGVGRLTLWLVELLTMSIFSFLLALGGEALVTAVSSITRKYSDFRIFDLYHQLFRDSSTQDMRWYNHIESILLFFSIFLFAYLAGMFISLVFYRLNKIWTVIVAVCVPLFLIFGLPMLVKALNLSLAAPVNFILSSPWILILHVLLLSDLVALFIWLLLRRAPVKAPVA